MLDEGLVEFGVLLVDVLADLGDAIRGGWRVRRAAVAGMWLALGATGWMLWRSFEYLFNDTPGWAVLAGGTWLATAVLVVAVTAAWIRLAVNRAPT